ncbi:MAG TPA: SRPBCC domain-containing protein [Chryseolinea sp.]
MKATVADNHVVNKSIRIKGTPAQVWDALTNPEKTKEYFFNCEVISDWKVGRAITFKGRVMLKKIELRGEILAIEPERLLKYTLKNSEDEHQDSISTVTDRLEYANGETVVSITDDVGAGPGAEKRYEKSMQGWDNILSGLKTIVEKETP